MTSGGTSFALSVGWGVLSAAWQTTLVALLYALWRRHTRAGIRRRHDAAALTLIVAALAALASLLPPSLLPPSVTAVDRPTASVAPTKLERQAPGAGVVAAFCLVRPRLALASASLMRRELLLALAGAWICGASILSLRLTGGWLLVARLRRRATPVSDAQLRHRFHELQRRLGIERAVELLESVELAAPATVGWRRPAVLLPTRVLRSTRDVIEPLLAHELAHVKAADYAANLVQTAVDVLLFPYPGARWLSAEVRRLREYRSDDLASALCGERTRYVRALGSLVAGDALHFTSPALSAAAPRLADRMRRLLEGDVMLRPTYARSAVLILSMVLATAAGSALPARGSVNRASSSSPAPRLAAPNVCTAGSVTSPWDTNSIPFPAGSVRRPWDINFTLTTFTRFPGNEFEPQNTPDKFFFCNPVRIDGAAVDWPVLATASRGSLTMVYGDPASTDAVPIPFRVLLRRNGELVNAPGTLLGREVMQFELHTLLELTHGRDHLILAPTNPVDWRAKRIVALGGC